MWALTWGEVSSRIFAVPKEEASQDGWLHTIISISCKQDNDAIIYRVGHSLVPRARPEFCHFCLRMRRAWEQGQVGRGLWLVKQQSLEQWEIEIWLICLGSFHWSYRTVIQAKAWLLACCPAPSIEGVVIWQFPYDKRQGWAPVRNMWSSILR